MGANINELNHDRIQAEIANIFSEIEKMRAETLKINNENRWYPLIVGSTATLAIVAIVKIFL
ncbi:MAG: hypothetical protein ACI85N_000930 [Gammaproteobacteria bacterium]|jgi:hypothetical protein